MSLSGFIILALLIASTWTPLVSVQPGVLVLQLPGGTLGGVIVKGRQILAVIAEDSDVGRATTTTTPKKKRKARKGPKPWWTGRVKAKAGVKIEDLKPEALEALKIVYLLYRCVNRTLTVTSTNDGKHMKGSKHYSGHAFDCRVWDFTPNLLLTMVKDVKALLGDSFDVVNEDSHLHVEFDPLRSKLTR